MIDIVVAFLAGLFFGSAFGTFIVALLTVTKDGDDHDGLWPEEMEKHPDDKGLHLQHEEQFRVYTEETGRGQVSDRGAPVLSSAFFVGR